MTELTDDQTRWLRRILETRPKKGPFEQFLLPNDIREVLVEQGMIRWHQGAIEITLDGIRAIAMHPPLAD